MPTSNAIAFGALAVLLSAASAFAYPEGAPWGAAHPDAEESCASCHFDDEPVNNSPLLSLAGMPAHVRAGQRIDFDIRFVHPSSTVAGFQLLIEANQQGAGKFETQSRDIEAIGAAVRSTVPAKSLEEATTWKLTWLVPPLLTGPVQLHAAALSGNDDGSPLGDKVHFRTFTVHPAEKPADK